MTSFYLSATEPGSQNQLKEEELIQDHIIRLKNSLDKKLSLESFTALSNKEEDMILLISYAGNSFVRIAKNQLIAVIIGGLLLISASKLLYEK